MRTHVNQTFQLKPLVVATALALGVPIVAQAAPTANQMPGGGLVTQGNVTANTAVNKGGAAGPATFITGLGPTANNTLTVTGNSVVTWGTTAAMAGGGTAELTTNPAGFNIGSSATLNVKAAASKVGLLNVDVSGGVSNISGSINDTSAAGNGVAVFVANQKGVTIGGTGRISLGAGFGALGVNLESTSAQADFAAVAGKLDLNMQNAAPVIIQAGAVIGQDTKTSTANSFVLLAGSNVTNAGVIVTQSFNVDAGFVQNPGGVGKSTLYVPGSQALAVPADVGTVTLFGGTDTVSYTAATGSFTNSTTGLVSSSGTDMPLYVNGGLVDNSGTLSAGSTTTAQTIFSTSTGFTNESSGTLAANILNIAAGTGDVNLGGHVTAFDPTSTPSGINRLQGLAVTSTGNVNITTPITVANSGTATGDQTPEVIGTDGKYYQGTTAATSRLALGAKILPPAATPVVSSFLPYFVQGNSVTITAAQTVASDPGSTTAAPGDLRIAVNNLQQPITLTSPGSLSARNVLLGGSTSLDSPNVTVTGQPPTGLAGNIVASGNVVFIGNSFGGDSTGKAIISTPSFYAITTANVNNPVCTGGGSCNWLQNGVNLTPPSSSTSPLNVVVVANGSGFQPLNLHITGDANVQSGTAAAVPNPTGVLNNVPAISTSTVFGGTANGGGPRPITTGTTGGGSTPSNGGSHLILNATGSITVNTDTNPNGNGGFNFPGQLVFEAGKAVTTTTIVDNVYATVAQSGSGIYFDAPTIATNGLIFTNGNSWVNFSQTPVGGIPAIYQLQQPTPATLQFVNANAVAPHQNSYKAIYVDQPATSINFTVLQ